MEFHARHGSLTEQPCDVVVVNLFEGVRHPGGGTGAVDRALGGAIAEAIEDQEFEGSLGDCLVLDTCASIPPKRVVVVGLGKSDRFGPEQVMRAAGSAARKCQELRAKSVASILHGAGIAGLPAADCAKAVTLGTVLGTYEFTRLKTEKVKPNPIQSFDIVEMSAEKICGIEAGIEHGKLLGDAVVFARDLVNEPSNVVTPAYLASVAEDIAREAGMECRVRDRSGIEEAGMGLLSAVSRGASQEPRFVELRYTPPRPRKTIGIAGKGITFDTGGYSLKTAESMARMKDDMAGAAAVLAAMRAVSLAKPDVSVIALIPATENAIGDNAIHPSDVFTSFGGKTVEVNNTDAEGRLILADAVAYAATLGVDEIIDLATLTGACVVALGREMSGVFGSDQALVDRLLAAGRSCGERLWQLPLFADYKESLKSDVADLKNTGGSEGAAINGALFIESFTNGIPWAHLDLSSAVVEKDTHLARKGATGVGVGTLIEYLLEMQ